MLASAKYINKNSVKKLLTLRNPSLGHISKGNLSYGLFFITLALSCFSSIHILYTWPIASIYEILCVPFCLFALKLSSSTSKPIFTEKKFMLPALLCLCVRIYMCIVNAMNPSEYVLACANFCIVAVFFMYNKSKYPELASSFCKWLGAFLIISIFAYFLHIIGFGLSGTSIAYGNYSYTNYYLFLLDDRSLWDIILPRFHSIFLEPGHLGTVVVMLLATQIGKWDRWYNIVLFAALLLSFSLAAYGLLVILLFLRLWLLRQKIFAKIIILATSIAILVGGSYIYNDGDNLLNQLIVARLEMNDKGDDIEGNNRVSESFKKDFDAFLQSDDIMFGKEIDMTIWGNSGYRVFIYDYGLVGVLLFLTFYFFAFRTGKDQRAIIAAFILATTNFWIRGYPIHNIFWVSYVLIAHINITEQVPEKQPTTETPVA